MKGCKYNFLQLYAWFGVNESCKSILVTDTTAANSCRKFVCWSSETDYYRISVILMKKQHFALNLCLLGWNLKCTLLYVLITKKTHKITNLWDASHGNFLKQDESLVQFILEIYLYVQTSFHSLSRIVGGKSWSFSVEGWGFNSELAVN